MKNPSRLLKNSRTKIVIAVQAKRHLANEINERLVGISRDRYERHASRPRILIVEDDALLA
jgi:hypothetical protein